jgi:hypothetical protein
MGDGFADEAWPMDKNKNFIKGEAALRSHTKMLIRFHEILTEVGTQGFERGKEAKERVTNEWVAQVINIKY